MAQKASNRSKIVPQHVKNVAGKDPRVPAVQNFDKQTPNWQLGRMDDDGPWGWSRIGKERWQLEILPKLRNIETMTWADIQHASGGKSSGTNSHFIPVGDLCKDAQDRLRALKYDDIDEVFSLRLKGVTRVFGIREGRTLKLLWFDFNHEICPSKKK